MIKRFLKVERKLDPLFDNHSVTFYEVDVEPSLKKTIYHMYSSDIVNPRTESDKLELAIHRGWRLEKW